MRSERTIYIMSKKIKAFTDLNSWLEAHKLALELYRATESFPKKEQFGLTSQMRRCAVSVPSNIAEGFNRFSTKEKIQFYSIALGSLSELQSQLMLALDLTLMPELDYLALEQKCEDARRLLNGLIRSIRKS